jgi:hypothetical protein
MKIFRLITFKISITCNKSAINDRLGIVLDRLLLALDVLRLEVHPQARQREDLFRPLLTLRDLALLLARRGQRWEPLDLVLK